MNNFIIENHFLVLAKSIKNSKPDKDGKVKQYGVISLYCPDTDEFQKITIFDNYSNILQRYDSMKSYKMKIKVSIVTKDGLSKTYMEIL